MKCEESNQLIEDLKLQLAESRRVEEVISINLQTKMEYCQKLEAEVLSLGKQLEKVNQELKRSLQNG